MLKMINRFAASLAIASMLSLNIGATTVAPAPVTHTALSKTLAAHTAAHVTASHLPNPHLHGAKPAVEKKIAKEHVARRWVHRWSFAAWAALHRGTGTVEGEVHNASGTPMAAVQMVLRHAHGGVIKNWNDKHITTTGAGGAFIMRNVRIGTYRVHGSKGKASGASTIHVHGGAMTLTAVKI